MGTDRRNDGAQLWGEIRGSLGTGLGIVSQIDVVTASRTRQASVTVQKELPNPNPRGISDLIRVPLSARIGMR